LIDIVAAPVIWQYATVHAFATKVWDPETLVWVQPEPKTNVYEVEERFLTTSWNTKPIVGLGIKAMTEGADGRVSCSPPDGVVRSIIPQSILAAVSVEVVAKLVIFAIDLITLFTWKLLQQTL